jgi:predicted ArsR family transcriptional regulator
METSRQQVFAYIRSQRSVTAGDISRALGMTPANARHHLNILQALDLIVATTHRKQGGKGRPARVFRLSEKASGNNLGLLAAILLEELFVHAEAENLASMQRKIAKRLAQVSEIQDIPVNQAARLFHAVQRLNQYHYQARWEARSSAPRLILSNCPYLEISETVPVICEIDAALIQELAGLPASLKEKLAHDSRGGIFCSFQLGVMRNG